MKSKRRHELQTNELADSLGHWIDRVRPHLLTGALAILALVAVVMVYFFWSSSNEKLVTEGWRSYLYATSATQGDQMVKTLKDVANEFSDTQAGLWAGQTAADVQAAEAVPMLFQDRDTAEADLSASIKEYRAVLASERIDKNAMLQLRAHFGLAQALEANANLDDAVEHYQAVVDVDADTAMGVAAQRRIDRLSTDEVKAWYNDWFVKQVPAPPVTDPLMGAGGNLEDLPSGPGASFMDELEVDGDATTEPAKSADTEQSTAGAESTGEPEAQKPAAKEADPAAAEETGSDGPSLEGPAVEGPAITPPAGKEPAEPKKAADGE